MEKIMKHALVMVNVSFNSNLIAIKKNSEGT